MSDPLPVSVNVIRWPRIGPAMVNCPPPITVAPFRLSVETRITVAVGLWLGFFAAACSSQAPVPARTISVSPSTRRSSRSVLRVSPTAFPDGALPSVSSTLNGPSMRMRSKLLTEYVRSSAWAGTVSSTMGASTRNRSMPPASSDFL